MSKKCSATKADGTPCLCFARLDDPADLCMFHSRLSAEGTQRIKPPLTKADLVKMLDSTIRQIKNAKKLNPLERSRELRALIIEREKLMVETPEPEALSLADRLKRAKSCPST